jgi:uncharacterized membrane protein YozB (DUF420 family)
MTDRPRITGFLPWRAPVMLDVLAVAMVIVLPALLWSLYSVKYRRRYQQHKTIQLALGSLLLTLLVGFEIDIQYFENWRQRAALSPYFDAASGTGLVMSALRVHLVFAITTLVLWVAIIFNALARFPKPPGPNHHSGFHARWGKVAAIDMVLTAATGWVFYFLAFVA